MFTCSVTRYFGFCLKHIFPGQRFTELQHILHKLSDTRPENHRMLHIIVVHLMTYVMVMPQVNYHCLRASLQSLHFKGTMNHFGMFFLHGFDLPSCHLREIDQQDPKELMVVGSTLKYPRLAPKKTGWPLQLTEGHDRENFLWGELLSWQWIQDLLETECCSSLCPWEFDCGEEEDTICKKLFKTFTQDIWLSLGAQVVESNRLPNPQTLEDAMWTWTPQCMEQILGKD